VLDLANEENLHWPALLVSDVREAAPGVDFLLVGAVARDVLLSYAHGIPLARATEDMDLALAITDWDAFEALRRSLLDSSIFQITSLYYRLRHRSGILVDLIPFGGVERPDGSIAWPPEYAHVLDVLGFAEARESAVEVRLPGHHIMHVVALPMLAVLKILAWADRHWRAPLKDAADLFAILTWYLDAGQDERLYSEAAHLLEDPSFDYRVAGAWLAGHDARVLVDRHSQRPGLIIEKLTTVLRQETDIEGPLRLAAEARGIDPEYARRLLTAFLAGFSGSKTP